MSQDFWIRPPGRSRGFRYQTSQWPVAGWTNPIWNICAVVKLNSSSPHKGWEFEKKWNHHLAKISMDFLDPPSHAEMPSIEGEARLPSAEKFRVQKTPRHVLTGWGNPKKILETKPWGEFGMFQTSLKPIQKLRVPKVRNFHRSFAAGVLVRNKNPFDQQQTPVILGGIVSSISQTFFNRWRLAIFSQNSYHFGNSSRTKTHF